LFRKKKTISAVLIDPTLLFLRIFVSQIPGLLGYNSNHFETLIVEDRIKGYRSSRVHLATAGSHPWVAEHQPITPLQGNGKGNS